MIQEPPHHQQNRDLIALPILGNSMNTNQNPNTNLKLNLTKPCREPSANSTDYQQQANSKNRTTVIQIPRQTSKPRIFLLTRPAKPPLIRTAIPQTVEVYQKDLKQVPHHHLPNVTKRISPPILRIPFLARSQAKTGSAVKGQTIQNHPQEVPSYRPLKDLNQIQVTVPQQPKSELKLKDSLIVHQEIIRYPTTKLTSSLPSAVLTNQASSPKSVRKSPIHQENTVHLAKNKNISKPLSTLASMAGIELTGADMSHTAADMSGAMPPTATVEEINVPVFIDEYLQQAAISTLSATTTTSSTSATTQNISNNNNSQNNNNNSSSSGKGNINEVKQQSGCLVDTFENFDFDIELLTETKSKDQDKALPEGAEEEEEGEQTQLSVESHSSFNKLNTFIEDTSDNIEAEKEQQQKQQLQLMLDEILFGNNNNQSCSNYNNNNISLSNNNYTITNNNNIINNSSNSNSNKHTIPMAINNMTDTMNTSDEALFELLPSSQNLSNDFDLDELYTFSAAFEEAVDINQINNEALSLEMNDEEYSTHTSDFINSQGHEIMLSSVGPPLSQCFKANTSVAALSQEILEAIPHVSTDLLQYSHSASGGPSSSSLSSSAGQHYDYMESSNEQSGGGDYSNCALEEEGMFVSTPETVAANPLKRNISARNNKHMQEKRLKLRLDSKLRKEVVTEGEHQIDTPSIIKILDELNFMQVQASPAPEETSTDIYNRLISISTPESEVVVKSEHDDVDYSNDISPPYTPYSVNSNSNQTNFSGFLNQSPNSPTSSIATTYATSTSTSATTRRGRGRPAKIHSDMPDISQIAHLPESEQKKVLERAKNNEASRKSRLKNKERDIAIEREERELRQHNEELNMEFQDLKRIERKLRLACKRHHNRGSPY